MSHLKFYAYEGHGVRQQKVFRYSQAVRIGDRIECSGQGKEIELRMEFVRVKDPVTNRCCVTLSTD